MREARDIAKRMREMLTMDKVGIKEGFSTALTNDLNRLLGDYFELISSFFQPARSCFRQGLCPVKGYTKEAAAPPSGSSGFLIV